MCAYYEPIVDGRDKYNPSVLYSEIRPEGVLKKYVHCFWEIRSEVFLKEDFILHAVPDACVNIMLNQLDRRIAGVTALQTKYVKLNLGRFFHYVGIQFFPGVFKNLGETVFDCFVDRAYEGVLPLCSLNESLEELCFEQQIPSLKSFAELLLENGWLQSNPISVTILTNLKNIISVADMANCVGLSQRQLQRRLQQELGFCPHDFLKVLRLQEVMRRRDIGLYYSDQSHFIRDCKKVLGETPQEYLQKYYV